MSHVTIDVAMCVQTRKERGCYETQKKYEESEKT